MEKERLNYGYHARSPSVEPCQLCGRKGADNFGFICKTCGKTFDANWCSRCFLSGEDKIIMRRHVDDDIHKAVDLI